jgi:hypothetical protein
MPKLVEIDMCYKCYLLLNDGKNNYCKYTGCIVHENQIIHPNCPLPNAPEGAHCADTSKTE